MGFFEQFQEQEVEVGPSKRRNERGENLHAVILPGVT